MATMTGAEALVRSLAREGVEVIFGLPGVQIMEVLDVLHDQPGIRLVTVRHEQAAAYMADGYARSTGKVGVAMVVPGPGALNASAAVATAYSCSSPVLLISGQMETYHLGKRRGALHEIDDQLDVFRPITKWCARVLEPSEIPGTVHEAMKHLTTGRPRPVELEIPWDVLPTSGNGDLSEAEVFPRQEPDASKIKETAELLSNARRPLIWAGGGTIAADASREVLELAKTINAPVITTHQAKGIIPEDNPMSLGVFYYGHGPGHLAMPQADVILAVGSRLQLAPNVPWAFQPHQKLIHIDADPDVLGKDIPAQIAINADARLGLRALLMELGGAPASEWRASELASIGRSTYREIKEMAPLQVSILETLRKELDDDAIVVGGITDVGYWSYLALPVLRPRSYLSSSYFATLGFAFPTAMGAKVAHPERQVVAICGDGGFMYGIPDLATAVQHNIGLVTLVFNNDAFGASLSEQRDARGGRVYGTELHNPDFARLAESFGATGVRLSSPDELGGALRSALRSEGPVVIEVPMPVLVPPFQIPAPGMS